MLSGAFDFHRQWHKVAGVSGPDHGSSAFRLISFNIRVDTASDGDNSWAHRKESVAAVLRFHHADIACLQEAYSGMIHDLAQRLPDYEYYGVGTTDGKDGGAHNPVFFRAARFRLVSSQTFWLSPSPSVPSRGWDAAYERAATQVELLDLYTGKIVHVFNTHLDHEGAQAREEGARLIGRRIQPVKGEVIVAGDFNSMREEAPWRLLTGNSLQDVQHASQTGHFGLQSTFNDFKQCWDEHGAIDFILVSPGTRVLQEGVPCTLFDGKHASDHFPVVADLSN